MFMERTQNSGISRATIHPELLVAVSPVYAQRTHTELSPLEPFLHALLPHCPCPFCNGPAYQDPPGVHVTAISNSLSTEDGVVIFRPGTVLQGLLPTDICKGLGRILSLGTNKVF